MKFEEFICRFEKRRKTNLGFLVRCPAHDDSEKTPSLHVCPSRDGGLLLKCFAGCSAQQVVETLGLTMKDLFAKEQAKKFTPPYKPEPKTIQPDEKPTIEKIYSYEDANGNEVCQALRLKPKSFRQRHRDNGQWNWTMDGVERVLYRLPQILKSETVWIFEGEKDVENMLELGFEGTCNIGGAGKWLDSYSESLAGKHVIICGDNDDPGKKHVDLVFQSLSEKAKSIKIITLPKTCKDASDYIAMFKTKEEAKQSFFDLVSASHPHVRGKLLPVYSIHEIEADYRRMVRNMSQHSYSLGRWLPTLGSSIRDLVPGELVFIIGDTGTGKTGLLQNIALSARPIPRIMFELELPKEMMFERFASISRRIPGHLIEHAYQTHDESISDEIEHDYKGLVICPVARLTVEKMEDIIMRSELKLGERPRMVLIDYIQLIGGGGKSRYEKFSEIAESLKVMAKETRTIVICASQISRPKDVSKNWEPTLHSAKESGSIEQSCGVLMSVWQDMNEQGVLNLRVLKSTKGGTGTFVKCNFDGARMIITERSKISDADVP